MDELILLGANVVIKREGEFDNRVGVMNCKHGLGCFVDFPNGPKGEYFEWSEVAQQHRVLITGWPGTGKTTLATKIGGGRCTDETIPLGWSEGGAEVVKWLTEPYTIIEGVAIPRALRKYHEQFPDNPPPVDKIIHLTKVYKDLDNRQIGMGKGIDKVWTEILPWLRANNVEIE